jgi:hypothetical protein
MVLQLGRNMQLELRNLIKYKDMYDCIIQILYYILAYIQHNGDVSLEKKEEDTNGIDIAHFAVCVGVCNFNSHTCEELRYLLCMEHVLVKSVFVIQII